MFTNKLFDNVLAIRSLLGESTVRLPENILKFWEKWKKNEKIWKNLKIFEKVAAGDWSKEQWNELKIIKASINFN